MTEAPRRAGAVLVCIFLLAIAPDAFAAPRTSAQIERGWSSPQAFELLRESIQARASGDLATCVKKAQTSLAIEEHPYARLHLSLCLAQTGRLTLALDSAKTALAAGLRSGDAELVGYAQRRVQEILLRLAHVRLELPANADEKMVVTFDGIPVRPHLLRQRVAVDPGDHVITAEKTIGPNERATFKEVFILRDGEDRTVEVIVKPSNLTDSERECAEDATTYEAKLACFERAPQKPNARVGVEMSGYTDTLSVHVVSPAINAAVVSPTGGWNVGGGYLVDIVTAASPDIVSMASRRFREQRHAGSLSGGYRLGPLDPQLHGNVSSEPDYLSMTAGGSVSTELNEKLVTPRVGYSFTRDRIGIRNTPFSQFERNLTAHEIEAGATFVLSRTTLLVAGLTLRIERGEQSKLYRYVPMFTKGNADVVTPGMSASGVNHLREDVRPREVLPGERDRAALAARLNHRVGSTTTVRAEERLYVDSWDLIASTSDARYLVDLSDRLRIGPHVRFHYQTAASFYRLAYVVSYDDGGQPIQIPAWRTGDRELSRMMTITAGAASRVGLSSPQASVKYALVMSGDVMWSRFFESLFVKRRTAVYGTVGLEVEL